MQGKRGRVSLGSGRWAAARGLGGKNAITVPILGIVLLGPVDPSFRALSGHLEFAVRRHRFNKYSLLLPDRPQTQPRWGCIH